MPDAGVYHIPEALLLCFPTGWYPSDVGSNTFTESLLLPGFSALVMSRLKGAKPPVWLPTLTPFTNTSAFQSTPPKLSLTFFPFHAEGIVNVRLYHRMLSFVSVFPTPESEDSMG